MKRNALLWAVLIYLCLAGNSFGAFVDFRTPPFDTCTPSPATSCTRTVGGVQVTIEGWTDVNNDNALNPLVDAPANLWWDNLDGFGVQSSAGYEPDEVDGPEFLIVRFDNRQVLSQLSFTDFFYEGPAGSEYQEIGYYRLTVGVVTGAPVQFLADTSQVIGSTNGVLNLALSNEQADNIMFTAPGIVGSQGHEFSVAGLDMTTATADLSITKTDALDPVTLGQDDVTYTVTVTNNGPHDATGVTVTDTLPGGVTFGSATPSQGSCVPASGTVTCDLGTLAFPGSATVTIVVTPTAAGTLSNSASVLSSTNDPTPGNNTAGPVTTTVNPVTIITDIQVTQTVSPASVDVGIQTTFTITVTNNGPDPATGVTLTDTLPSGVTFNSNTSPPPSQGSCTAPSGGAFTCNLGNLANGASATITLKVTPLVEGTIANIASVAGNESESTTVNNSATATANVGDVSRLVNISTRAPVQTGDNVMIGGFYLGGNLPKQLLIRARGPSLGSAPFFNEGVLNNPTIQLYSGATVIAQNDNWGNFNSMCLSPCVSNVEVTNVSVPNMTPCEPNPTQTSAPPNCGNESALLVTLPPGGYTAIVSGVGGTSGVGLVEVFDLDTGTQPKLVNISTRARVLTGDSVMIGGFWIAGGTGSKTVLMRARGPSLGAAPFTNDPRFVLANPTVELYSGGTVIAQNDQWDQQTGCTPNGPLTACGDTNQIIATGLDPCQPNPGETVAPPNCGSESALLVTLSPGGYTMIVRGAGGGTGLGLVEIFELSP